MVLVCPWMLMYLIDFRSVPWIHYRLHCWRQVSDSIWRRQGQGLCHCTNRHSHGGLGEQQQWWNIQVHVHTIWTGYVTNERFSWSRPIQSIYPQTYLLCKDIRDHMSGNELHFWFGCRSTQDRCDLWRSSDPQQPIQCECYTRLWSQQGQSLWTW